MWIVSLANCLTDQRASQTGIYGASYVRFTETDLEASSMAVTPWGISGPPPCRFWAPLEPLLRLLLSHSWALLARSLALVHVSEALLTVRGAILTTLGPLWCPLGLLLSFWNHSQDVIRATYEKSIN